MSSKTKDIIYLLEKGFRPYEGEVPAQFYASKKCKTYKRAEWLTRPWSDEHQHTRFICLGCNRRCSAVDPDGWPLLLPIGPQTRPGAVAFIEATRLTADELLKVKRVLRVDEVAFILNVGKTKVFEMIQDGRLAVLPDSPTRVTSESVERQLQA